MGRKIRNFPKCPFSHFFDENLKKSFERNLTDFEPSNIFKIQESRKLAISFCGKFCAGVIIDI